MTFFTFTKEMNDEGVNITSGVQQFDGTLIGYKDNATSMRVKGPSSPSDPSAGADVQSFSGIFYNNAYIGTGTLRTRAIHGANIQMDLELQSPHQLRIVAVDDTQTDGQVYVSSKTNVTFSMRNNAETSAPAKLVLDRVNKGTTGVANTSDVEVSVSSGNLVFASIPVVPSYTVATANALGSKPAGAMIFVTDETGGAVLAFGDGTNWLRVTDRAIIS